MSRRLLLTTTTGEPYQPVRLTYSVPNRSQALRRIRRFRCIEIDDERGHASVWLDDEARKLDLDPPPPAWESFGQRILLGAISFPSPRAMSLQVRSIPRAIELAKMLRPALDTALPLVRVRLVNRWFHPDEHTGELDELDRHLDRDVTVIDWEKNAADLERATAGCRTPEEYQRRAAEYRAKQPDIPMVEDLPMHPEDENDRMRDLASTLHFRFARAARRWKGEDVTLNQVIDDFVRDHFSKPR